MLTEITFLRKIAIFSNTKQKNVAKRVTLCYIFAKFLNVWFGRRQMDSYNASAFSLLQYDVLEEKEAKEANSTSHRLVVRKERAWWTPWESLRDSPAVLGTLPKVWFISCRRL